MGLDIGSKTIALFCGELKNRKNRDLERTGRRL